MKTRWFLFAVFNAGLIAIVPVLIQAAPATGKGAEKRAMDLGRLYVHVLSIRAIHTVCDEVVPERAAVNRVVMQEFEKKHSLVRIEAFYANAQWKAPGLARIKDRFDTLGIPAMREKIKKNPDACSAMPLMLDEYARKLGSSDLGATFDALVTQPGSTASAAPSAGTTPPAGESKLAAPGSSAGFKKQVLDIYTTASVLRETVNQCKKISRKTLSANNKARKAYFDANLLHEMDALVKGEFEQDVAKLKPRIPVFAKQLLKENPGLCPNFAGYFANQARPFKKEQPELYRQAAEMYPIYFAKKPRGLLTDSNKVVYAERPKYHLLGSIGYYDDDFKYLDRKTLETRGESFKIRSTTYRYVAPLPEGARIEGAYKTFAGATSAAMVAIKSNVLRFARNGRYTTSSFSAVSANAPAGIGNSGRSNAGEGSYHITGYTLELRPDNGKPERIGFFPYDSRVFGTGAGKPAIDFLNIGRRVYARLDK